MRAVLTRVRSASVAIDGEIVGCDQCVEVLYTDEIYYQQAMRQAQQDYIDSAMWEQRKNDIG